MLDFTASALLLFLCTISLFSCARNTADKAKQLTIYLPGNVHLEMVRIPLGSFNMGSDTTELGHEQDESPVHSVTIGYDFYMAKYEITQAQWLSLMETWPDSARQPNPDEGVGDNYPAYYVSWNDCQEFLKQLSESRTAFFPFQSDGLKNGHNIFFHRHLSEYRRR